MDGYKDRKTELNADGRLQPDSSMCDDRTVKIDIVKVPPTTQGAAEDAFIPTATYSSAIDINIGKPGSEASKEQHRSDTTATNTAEQQKKDFPTERLSNIGNNNHATAPDPTKHEIIKIDNNRNEIIKGSKGKDNDGNINNDNGMMIGNDHVANGAGDDHDGSNNYMLPDEEQKGERVQLKAPNSFDSSLGVLAIKFTNLIKSSTNGLIDLNDAATILQVPKRRMNEMISILEGIGFIEKQNADVVRVKMGGDQQQHNRNDSSNGNLGNNNFNKDGKSCNSENSNLPLPAAGLEIQRLEKMRNEIEELYREDSKLDIKLAMMRKLSNRYLSKNNLYCTQEDVIEGLFSTDDINCPKGDNEDGDDNIIKRGKRVDSSCLIAIRAPAGSTMQVPHPGSLNGRKQYELRICNKTAKLPILNIEIPEAKHDAHSTTSVSADSINGEPVTKKCKVGNALDVQVMEAEVTDEHKQEKQDQHHQQQQTPSTPERCDEFDEIQPVPHSFNQGTPPMGVGNNCSVVDHTNPIDVYYMHCMYDSESKKHVSKSKAKRINPIALLVDEVARGSLVGYHNTNTPSLTKLAKSWLESECSVSDFFCDR